MGSQIIRLFLKKIHDNPPSYIKIKRVKNVISTI